MIQRPQARSPQTGGSDRCRLHAFRHETTGQFYALSHEDRAAFQQHCTAILEDLNPQNHREQWLATSIAEDQWRLNRARALENNIFALGMSGDAADATDAGNAEVHAAICQARVWLADGKKLQMLALYEQRIRRSIEKNEKQLQELQAERKAARDKALEEAVLLAQLAIAEGRDFDLAQDAPRSGESDGGESDGGESDGFGFSTGEITRLAWRELRLRQAARLQKQGWPPPSRMPRAA
jgi:hypothetical protein